MHNRHLFKELRSRPGLQIAFVDNSTGLRLPHVVSRSVNKAHRLLGLAADRHSLEKLIAEVAPDMWITDTSRMMMKLRQRAHGQPVSVAYCWS